MTEEISHLSPFFLEWRIEKFSCWMQAAHGTSITCCGSSLFDPGVIRLSLYPRGESGDGERMELTCVGPKNLFREECDLSFVGPPEFLFCVRPVEKVVDGNPIRVVGPKFQEVVSHIDDEEAWYGDHLTLKFHCKEPREHSVSMRTTLDVFDSEVSVTLPNPAFESKATMATIVLGVPSQDPCPPTIHLKYHAGREMFHLKLTNLKESISVQCLVHVFDDDNCLKMSTKIEDTFTNLMNKFYFSRDLITSDGMLALEQGGEAMFRFKIIKGSYKTDFRDIFQSVERSFTSASIMKDLRCLFKDRYFSDFELKCGTESFLVHRNILCARSPVFKAMLSSDMREAESGSVDIEDMDGASLKLFLKYLYTGSFKDVPCDSALQLYYAADKYQVPSLKTECAYFLGANVCVSNVCDVLSLGDRYGDDQLTLSAQNFILKNFKEVSMSKEWQEYMKTNPHLLLKTVTHLAGKGCFENSNSQTVPLAPPGNWHHQCLRFMNKLWNCFLKILFTIYRL